MHTKYPRTLYCWLNDSQQVRRIKESKCSEPREGMEHYFGIMKIIAIIIELRGLYCKVVNIAKLLRLSLHNVEHQQQIHSKC